MDWYIRIGKELVPVTEEVHKEYYKMARRERYMENDIKVGRIEIKNEKPTFISSKEDSMQRLMELGADFEDEISLEDIICDKATLVILQQAMAELNQQEQELIQAIYYRNLTTREISEQENVCQTTIVKRHKKALEKLKKYFL
jgi:RNA polymerase sigma factor (sigma-70 family)